MSIAHELITRGWSQGGGFEHPDGSVCLRGAAAYALGVELGDEPNSVWCLLRDLCGGVQPTYFNDDPARTFDEVLRIAKQADEILGL